jgi:hypothetical protein
MPRGVDVHGAENTFMLIRDIFRLIRDSFGFLRWRCGKLFVTTVTTERVNVTEG